MAEGFLIETPEENTMSMEEIGNEYFDSLLSSFFFQDVVKDEKGDVITCKMHDLVHDLARNVVGNHECLIVENVLGIDYILEATRRLNLLVDLDDDDEILTKVLEALKKKAKNLRTVIICQKSIRFDIGNAFKENKRLRVLDLIDSVVSSNTFFSSIGGLKHLRYIAINNVLFPKGMIGRLSFLQTLSYFKSGDLEELEGLNLLRVLSIRSLDNVTSGTTACRANLKEKKNLRVLNLIWDRATDNHEAVLEGLRPHPNLTTLRISGFQGSKLPSWIECLPNLVELDIKYCHFLSIITPTTTIFPSLKVLYLEYIDGSAVKTLVTNNLTSLTSLRLNSIPNLVSLPHQGLIENNNTLLSLEIFLCTQFEGFFPPNKDEEDDQGGQLQEVSSSRSSSSSSLQSLTLYVCPAMRLFPNIRSLASLRKFKIQGCNETQSLLDDFTSLLPLT